MNDNDNNFYDRSLAVFKNSTQAFSGKIYKNRYQGVWLNSTNENRLNFDLYEITNYKTKTFGKIENDFDLLYADQSASMIYNSLKFTDHNVADSKVLGSNQFHFQYRKDQRTNVSYPYVLFIDDANLSVDSINRSLKTRHDKMIANALECLGQDYYIPDKYGLGTGGFNDVTTTIHYASKNLIALTESGSVFCGGAHPYNFYDSIIYDLKKYNDDGVVNEINWNDYLDFDIIDEYNRQKNPRLINRLAKEFALPQEDAQTNCYDPSLLSDYLTFFLDHEGYLMIGNQGVPHIISVCNGPQSELPLSWFKEF